MKYEIDNKSEALIMLENHIDEIEEVCLKRLILYVQNCYVALLVLFH